MKRDPRLVGFRGAMSYYVARLPKWPHSWAAYLQPTDGSAPERRLISHHLPPRETPEDAEADLRTWLEGMPRTSTQKTRYGEKAR